MFKTLAITTATLLLGLSGVSVATAGNFEGLGLSASIGYVKSDVDYSYLDTDVSGEDGSTKDVAFEVGLSYALAISGDFITEVGLTYGLNSLDVERVNYTDTQFSDEYHLEATVKNHFSLYVSPGYRFQPNWLVYGKLAYHQMQVDYRDSATGKSSKTFDGIGYGLGLAYALGSNVEAGVEAQYIDYQSYRRGIVKAEPSTTQLSWLLTYRF